MNYSFDFDPAEILEVSPESPLEQLREAYRAKSKKHHPDAGGDEWAFRIVVRSYEILSRARVAGYLEDYEKSPAPNPASYRPAYRPQQAPPESGTVRKGIRDQVSDDWRLVDVELLILRLELDNPYSLITASAEDRNLSCSLSVNWPSIPILGASGAVSALRHAGLAIPILQDAFTRTVEEHRPMSAWNDLEDGRFTAMLGFSSARETSAAFQTFRAALKNSGFGVSQATRELIIPRDG